VATPARPWFGTSAIAAGGVAEKQGFVARTLAAARQAMGLGDTKSSVATRATDATVDSASESPAAAKGSLDGGLLPPSRAFTLWGEVAVSECAKTAEHQHAEANGHHLSLLPPLDLDPLSVRGEGSPV
jgi:hypothetical protein